MTKRTAIYLRVSSNKQSVESQRPEMERWADAYCDVPPVWFEDVSNQHVDMRKRPAWDALCAAIEAGEVDRVAVWKLDRLGRRAARMLEAFEWFEAKGVTFVSVTEGMRSDSPMFKLVATVIAAVAEYDNELRSERTRAGLAKSAGKRKTGPRKIVPQVEARIVEMYNAGCNAQGICEELGISKSSAHKVIRKHKESGRITRSKPLSVTHRAAMKRNTKLTPKKLAEALNMRAAGRPVTLIAQHVGLTREYLYDVFKKYGNDVMIDAETVPQDEETSKSEIAGLDFGVDLEEYEG